MYGSRLIFFCIALNVSCERAESTDTGTAGGVDVRSGGSSSARASSATSGGASSATSGGASSATSGGAATTGGATGSGMVDCDPRKVMCERTTPACDDGTVPSIAGSCYGPCVKIDKCACDEAADCPDALMYTCHLSAHHCGPFL